MSLFIIESQQSHYARGIELDSLAGSEIHAKYVFNRERNINSIKELFKMIKD